MSDEPITPTWPQILQAVARNHAKTMFGGWLPGRVQSYDEATCKATIELLVDDVYTEDGETLTKPFPIVNEVPIQFPGSGGIRIKWPIASGDYVTVLFASRSVDRWLQVGGHVSDPGDDRDHDLNDAVAIPGLLPFNGVSKASPAIEFTASEIQAGGTQSLGLKSDLSALKTAISGAAVVANDGGAALKANIIAALNTLSWPTGTSTLKGG